MNISRQQPLQNCNKIFSRKLIKKVQRWDYYKIQGIKCSNRMLNIRYNEVNNILTVEQFEDGTVSCKMSNNRFFAVGIHTYKNALKRNEHSHGFGDLYQSLWFFIRICSPSNYTFFIKFSSRKFVPPKPFFKFANRKKITRYC